MTALSRPHGLSGQARLAWLLAVASIAILAGGRGRQSPTRAPTSGPAVLILTTLVSLLGVGALLVTRVPGNAIGWWLILAGELVTVESLAQAATEFGVMAEPEPWTAIGLTALVPQLLEPIAIVVVLIVVPLHFPDGRLLSPRWRWVQWLTVVAITAGAMTTLFGPGNDGPYGVGLLANPLAAPGLQPLLDVLGTVAAVTVVAALVGAALSVIVRYRRSGGVERQQLKWLLAVASVAVVAFTAASVVNDEAVSNVLYLVGFAAVPALPVAIGIAILRYHLYDIDRIISRTVSWALITAVLVAVFVGGVLGLQAALAGRHAGADARRRRVDAARPSRSSSPSAGACSAPSTAGSIEPGTTASGRSTRSPIACDPTWTSRRWGPRSRRPPRTPCGRRAPGSGCAIGRHP